MTLMSVVPVPVGATAVRELQETSTENEGLAVAPKSTAEVPQRLMPVTVTGVPPASGPELGLTLETFGRAT
jgi:hypothetical protein